MADLYTLPPLPYDFDALEPTIDGATMREHHGKHHKTYVDKLNEAAGKLPTPIPAGTPIDDVLRNLDQFTAGAPADVKQAIINHGGGHANHTFFWNILAPKSGGEPTGKLADDIAAKFGSVADFKTQFKTKALARFGSGWVWLVRAGGGLDIVTTANQDSPLTQGQEPVIGLDLWEHAYYLKHKSARAAYVDGWWDVVNWPAVGGK